LSARARPLAFLAGLGYEDRDAAEVVESLLGCGYDAVEWTMAHVGDLREPAVALACQQDLVGGGEQALATTVAAIESAARSEIPVVNVVSGPNLWEPGSRPRDDEQAWSTALAALEVAAARGAALGVTIGFEPCWGTLAHDAATAQRVLDAVDVAVTFDPSHFVLHGEDVAELVRRWGDRIAHVHLKDAFGRAGREGSEFHFCMLGEGAVTWPELFEALDQVGYRGPLSVEFESYRYYEQVLGSDPEAAARLCHEQAVALLDRAAGERR